MLLLVFWEFIETCFYKFHQNLNMLYLSQITGHKAAIKMLPLFRILCKFLKNVCGLQFQISKNEPISQGQGQNFKHYTFYIVCYAFTSTCSLYKKGISVLSLKNCTYTPEHIREKVSILYSLKQNLI